MIPPVVAKWATRVVVTVALLLFASTFAYLMTRTGPTSIGPDGEKVTSLSEAELHTAVVLFCSTGWSFCAIFAVKEFASSSTAARALLRVLGPVGLGVFFAAFIPGTSGNMGLSMTLALSGFALVGLSMLLYFAFFGAKETYEQVQEGIGVLKDAIAHRSEAPTPFLPSATFLPEAQAGGGRPQAGESSPPSWSPPPPPSTWSPPLPPPVGPPPGSGSSVQ